MATAEPTANRSDEGLYSAHGKKQNSEKGLLTMGEFVSLETNNWLLHLLYIRGEHDACKQLAETELKESQGYSEYGNYIMGLILRIEGKIQESLEYFNKCCELNPRNVENAKQVARSLFLLGKFAQSVEKYTEALVLASAPDWNIYHNLGLCYTQMDKFEDAEEHLLRAVDLGQTEESHLALARLFVKKVDKTKAITMYKTVFILFPSNPEIAIDLGLLYIDMGEYHRAFDKFGTALAHDTMNPRALLALGAEFQRNDEFDVALAKYKLCAQNLPESSFLWNNIGMCFFSKKKYVAAISCLKRAVYLSPLDWKALFNLGLVHMHTRQYVSAFHFLSASVKSNTLYAPTFLLLALAFYSLTDVDSAKKAFEQALKISPDHPVIRVNYALFLKHLREDKEAQEQVELFYRLCPARQDPLLEELLQSTFTSSLSHEEIESRTNEMQDDEV